MQIYSEISSIVAKLESRLKLVTAKLKSCPSGHLSYERTGNKSVLIQETRVGGKRKRHKLSNDILLAEALVRKQVLIDEQAALMYNIKILKDTLSQIQEYTIDREAFSLQKQNPAIESNIIQSVFYKPELSAWEAEPYEQSDYKAEDRKQVNSRGLRLRSKSEVLISEKFYEYGIEFRYEEVLHIGDVRLVPDFTIRRNDGKIFVWEHEGLTNVKKYLEWQLKKTQLYATNGFVPWDNLIVSYDNSDGNIDLRVVESEIKNKLLI